MLTSFLERYLCQGLGLRVVEAEVQDGHLHALYRELPDVPVPVARYGGDQALRSRGAVRNQEVGEGQVRRSRGVLQAAALAQRLLQPVQRPVHVRLNKRGAREGIEVGEPDRESGE